MNTEIRNQMNTEIRNLEINIWSLMLVEKKVCCSCIPGFMRLYFGLCNKEQVASDVQYSTMKEWKVWVQSTQLFLTCLSKCDIDISESLRQDTKFWRNQIRKRTEIQNPVNNTKQRLGKMQDCYRHCNIWSKGREQEMKQCQMLIFQNKTEKNNVHRWVGFYSDKHMHRALWQMIVSLSLLQTDHSDPG